MFLVNGQAADQLPVTDRGLHYGDGLFETMAVMDGSIRHWQLHFQRLQAGCLRLQIPVPDQNTIESEIERLLSDVDVACKSVIKLIITRGSGGRGYKFPADVQPTRILGRYPWPDYPDDHARDGIELFSCETRLSQNVALAGVKHLNRLEQVLARNEWQDERYAEGLMRDQQGRVVEGTMSNLFWVRENRLYTPQLDCCGVRGVMRERLLQLAEELKMVVEIGDYQLQDMLAADGVFLCNSIIGLWPVRQLLQTRWAPHPAVNRLRKLLA